jgi:hypothetical protein
MNPKLNLVPSTEPPGQGHLPRRPLLMVFWDGLVLFHSQCPKVRSLPCTHAYAAVLKLGIADLSGKFVLNPPRRATGKDARRTSGKSRQAQPLKESALTPAHYPAIRILPCVVETVHETLLLASNQHHIITGLHYEFFFIFLSRLIFSFLVK